MRKLSSQTSTGFQKAKKFKEFLSTDNVYSGLSSFKYHTACSNKTVVSVRSRPKMIAVNRYGLPKYNQVQQTKSILQRIYRTHITPG